MATKDIVDKPLAKELCMWAENDYKLYKLLSVEWYNNFARKIGRGVFDKQKAIEGLARNYVPKVAQSYSKENRRPLRVSAATKLAVAKYLMNEVLIEDLSLTHYNGKGRVNLRE